MQELKGMDRGRGRTSEVAGLHHVTPPAVAVCRWEKQGGSAYAAKHKTIPNPAAPAPSVIPPVPSAQIYVYVTTVRADWRPLQLRYGDREGDYLKPTGETGGQWE
ncbi:hypothetical protein Q8A73_002500 [Channa argus]|nr:hypothetical protein Q8A73_002500 [Channa argus]